MDAPRTAPVVLAVELSATVRGQALAKRAASCLLGCSVMDHRLQIGHSPSGRPTIDACDVDVSISHTAGCTAAVAVSRARVGVDVEPLSPVPRRMWRYFLTDSEIQACDTLPARAVWAWTVKEALYKALDPKVAMQLKSVEVVGWGAATVQVAFHCDNAPRRSRIIQRYIGGFAITVAVLPED